MGVVGDYRFEICDKDGYWQDSVFIQGATDMKHAIIAFMELNEDVLDAAREIRVEEQ